MNHILGFSLIFSMSVSSFRTCWCKCATWFWFQRKLQSKEAFRSSWTAQEVFYSSSVSVWGSGKDLWACLPAVHYCFYFRVLGWIAFFGADSWQSR
ncbi:hypothetical protein KC19_VG189200 [Ceratodon purpureus]|uniref:Secreted protein n=1 Tax=Ceratodon purpureus TaxID=3225 RepID=A0A8T0HSQ6_CERPU|nr:hypothetical protein KC19_VG189200 [Ceratodon purpureus]